MCWGSPKKKLGKNWIQYRNTMYEPTSLIPWRQETHRPMKSTNCFASLAVDGTPTMMTAVTPSKVIFNAEIRNVKPVDFRINKSMVEIPNPSKSIDLCCFFTSSPQSFALSETFFASNPSPPWSSKISAGQRNIIYIGDLTRCTGPKNAGWKTNHISSFWNGTFLCHILIFRGK